MSVTEFAVKRLIPIVPKNLAHLLPTYPSEEITYTISGVSNAVSNALRRGPEEIMTKFLDCTGDLVLTDDSKIIRDYIANRVRSIPLQQKCAVGTKFELSVCNSTHENMSVSTHEIILTGYQIKQFNECELCVLRPGKQLYISGVVSQTQSRKDGSGMVTPASLCKSVVHHSIELPNTFDKVAGTPSRQANHMKWEMRFITPGIIDANELMKTICTQLMARCMVAKNALNDIISTKDLHELTLQDETHTLGVLILRECESIKELQHYSYKEDPVTSGIMLEFRCESDLKMILESIFDSIAHKFENLRDQF